MSLRGAGCSGLDRSPSGSKRAGWSASSFAEKRWRGCRFAARATSQDDLACPPGRFRRIASLARALGLGEPRAVAQGEFLERELTVERERVLLEISRTVSPEETEGHFPVRTYQRLLAHRVKAEHVIGFNRGVLECSIPSLAGVMVAHEAVAASLRESLSVVDGWLCGLFDPEGRTFSESELTKTFGWPDIDVRHQEAEEAWGE